MRNSQSKASQTKARNYFGIAFVLAMIVGAIVIWQFATPTSAYNGHPSQIIVINQVYGGGGVAGATYDHDFIELLNTSTVSVDISGWSLQSRAGGSGGAWTITNLCASTTPNTCVMPSGRYYLISGFSSGANGAALPAAQISNAALNISVNNGEIALVNSRTTLLLTCATIQTTGAPAAIDFIGYGPNAGTCAEGTAATNTGGSSALSLKRSDVTDPRDTDANSVDFPTATPNARNSSTAPVTPSAGAGEITGRMVGVDGSGIAGVVVNLSGTQSRKTITDANGSYRFSSVEAGGFYTVVPARADYGFTPGSRSFSQLGNNTEAIFTAVPLESNSNPLDTTEYFVRQQYVDMLAREPDEAGFNFWSDRILACGDDANCVNVQRREVAAAFFISTEFQRSGYFVYRLYKGAFGELPSFAQYLPDRNSVIGGANLDAARVALADDFVQRDAFRQAYPDALSNTAFVNQLFDTAGVADSAARQIEIDKLNNNGTRSEVLRDLIENAQFSAAEYNRAFVATEYYTYLRRTPEASGYQFWVNVLDQGDRGNYNGMVCSFVTAAEYQNRFGSVVTRSNSECSR